MKTRKTRFAKTRYSQLSELGTKFNLSFSSHEVLGDKLLALDGPNRKLMVIEHAHGDGQVYIINLDETSAITVQKNYNSIRTGDLKKNRLPDFLKSIQLQFEFGNGKNAIALPFFNRETNAVLDVPKLEAKISAWHLLLSKLIGRRNKKRNPEQSALQLSH